MEEVVQSLQPISLDETNKLARMLKRVDNKYVVREAELVALFESLKSEFAVLEIDGVRGFNYISCYFDDNLKCYHDHHQGKRLRFKTRTRRYVESGEMYFEVKLKDKRGSTNKGRIPCKKFNPPRSGGANHSMLAEFYGKKYKKEFNLDLQPSLYVKYKRLTLVALQGGERITIDYHLCFEPISGAPVNIGNDFIIVETKSEDGRGLADTALKNARIRKVKKCSKYCIGVVLTGNGVKYNNFKPIVSRISRHIVLERNDQPAPKTRAKAKKT